MNRNKSQEDLVNDLLDYTSKTNLQRFVKGPRGRFEVTFASEELAKKFISRSEKKSMYNTVTNCLSPNLTVTAHWVQDTVRDDELAYVIGKYAKVISGVRSQMFYQLGCPSGRRTLLVERTSMSGGFPQFIRIGPAQIMLTYEGQVPTCFKCKGKGHIGRNCDSSQVPPREPQNNEMPPSLEEENNSDEMHIDKTINSEPQNLPRDGQREQKNPENPKPTEEEEEVYHENIKDMIEEVTKEIGREVAEEILKQETSKLNQNLEKENIENLSLAVIREQYEAEKLKLDPGLKLLFTKTYLDNEQERKAKNTEEPASSEGDLSGEEYFPPSTINSDSLTSFQESTTSKPSESPCKITETLSKQTYEDEKQEEDKGKNKSDKKDEEDKENHVQDAEEYDDQNDEEDDQYPKEEDDQNEEEEKEDTSTEQVMFSRKRTKKGRNKKQSKRPKSYTESGHIQVKCFNCNKVEHKLENDKNYECLNCKQENTIIKCVCRARRFTQDTKIYVYGTVALCPHCNRKTYTSPCCQDMILFKDIDLNIKHHFCKNCTEINTICKCNTINCSPEPGERAKCKNCCKFIVRCSCGNIKVVNKDSKTVWCMKCKAKTHFQN